jgi:carboxypeptidase Taq
MKAYTAIEDVARRLDRLGHARSILQWDEAVMMPTGGAEARGAALAELAVLSHETAARPELPDLIAQAGSEIEAAEPGPERDWRLANLREFEREWRAVVCLPADLVARSTLARVRSEQAWRRLRPQSDWAAFRPLLEEVMALKREEATFRAEASGLDPYDALLELYDPGTRCATIDPVFADLQAFLPDFIAAVVERQGREALTPLAGPFPVAAQRSLGVEMMQHIGFDFASGRLDLSHHPFCGGVPGDVRITTRYDEADFTKSFMAVLHETGHARYEQGRDPTGSGQPAVQPRGMGFHESQSLITEMQLARSPEFLAFAAPIIRRHFGIAEGTPGWDPDNLHRLYTRVRPGYIRVDADEATYPVHVILRYELEKALISGDLRVAELPGAWEEKMRSGLGLSIGDNHRDGCMQDVHWAAGLVGYFPSYTLGALIAAQLMAALKRERPTLDQEIRRGEFGAVGAWLLQRVWSRGSQLPAEALLREATGHSLDAEYFKAHLRRRYLGGD